MRIGFNTIPPECMNCGIIDSPDIGKPVERHPDNDNDPKWSDWLCAECRFHQWHETPDDGVSLREYLGQSELEHKYWVEARWDLFEEAHVARLCGE